MFHFLSDVSVDMPDELDLSPLRGQGLQPGEEDLPDETTSQSVPGMWKSYYLVADLGM